jgi:hypothetical protein
MAAVYVARVPKPMSRHVEYRLHCLVEMLEELGVEDREDLQNVLSCVAAVADFFNQGVLMEISSRLRKKANVLRESDHLCDLHAAAALDDEAHDLDVERVLMSERDDDASEEELDEVLEDA